MGVEINMLDLDQIEKAVPTGKPFFMINLLQFRATAEGDGVGEPQTGQQAYFSRYLPAFEAVAQSLGLEGIRPVWAGMVAGVVAGHAGETWDAAAVVQYPSFEAFRRIVESEAYSTQADPHRRAALADWRLYPANAIDLGPA